MLPADFIRQLSHYAIKNIPCLFIIDFAKKSPLLFTEPELQQQGILYSLPIAPKLKLSQPISETPICLDVETLDEQIFQAGFSQVQEHIAKGDSYLLNLCYAMKIKLNCSLEQVFRRAKAPYKLYVPRGFVVFSPEAFVRIRNNQIATFPMKGTISATIPQAEQILLNDNKEIQEHNTIVDLMRNDLAQVAHNVQLKRYRYVEKINTHKGAILQTSSEIVGDLPVDWRKNLGNILYQLLPAGSISGAPKAKTLEIIRKVELDNRGYYTGIFGYYDGQNLDSAVAIRFIEKRGQDLFFRAGGGITFQSEAQAEYREILQKIYVPTT